jgi:hypothetical protein
MAIQVVGVGKWTICRPPTPQGDRDADTALVYVSSSFFVVVAQVSVFTWSLECKEALLYRFGTCACCEQSATLLFTFVLSLLFLPRRKIERMLTLIGVPTNACDTRYAWRQNISKGHATDTDALGCRTVVTRAGDAIVIPRLVAHKAVAAGDEASLHMTISNLGTESTWGNVLRGVIKRHPDSSRMEARLKQAEAASAQLSMTVPHNVGLDVIIAELLTRLHTLCNGDKECGFFNERELSDAVNEVLPHHAEVRHRIARQSLTPRACVEGTQSETFMCDNGEHHLKTKTQWAGMAGYDCDCFFGNACCDRDMRSPNYGRCDTVCSMCTCPRGQRLYGCSSASFYEAGTCVRNDAGGYCNEGSAQIFCASGLECRESWCCSSEVQTENCLGCQENTGICISHVRAPASVYL